MKLNKLLTSTALGVAVALGSTAAFADGHAKELTIVSWGGAYTKIAGRGLTAQAVHRKDWHQDQVGRLQWRHRRDQSDTKGQYR